MRKLIPFLSLILFTTACAVGPNYRRPKVDVPGEYRGASPQDAAQPQPGQQGSKPAGDPPQQSSQSSEPSFGDQKWWEVFQDPELQELIRTALQNNYDVRIAAARIMEARAVRHHAG